MAVSGPGSVADNRNPPIGEEIVYAGVQRALIRGGKPLLDLTEGHRIPSLSAETEDESGDVGLEGIHTHI